MLFCRCFIFKHMICVTVHTAERTSAVIVIVRIHRIKNCKYLVIIGYCFYYGRGHFILNALDLNTLQKIAYCQKLYFVCAEAVNTVHTDQRINNTDKVCNIVKAKSPQAAVYMNSVRGVDKLHTVFTAFKRIDHIVKNFLCCSVGITLPTNAAPSRYRTLDGRKTNKVIFLYCLQYHKKCFICAAVCTFTNSLPQTLLQASRNKQTAQKLMQIFIIRFYNCTNIIIRQNIRIIFACHHIF